jgi:predicted DNA-binding protein (UPF0251 family)
MARPTKWRRVAFIPQVTYFKPVGIPLRMLEEVGLTVEELEAIRLKDVEGLQQEECAEKMHVSRPTFHRVLESARQKVADALINGKAVRIEGGNFALPNQSFRCRRDGYEWIVPFEAMAAGLPLACPRCDSPSVLPVRSAGPASEAAAGDRGVAEAAGKEADHDLHR